MVERVKDRYLFEQQIGSGGMAKIYKAKDKRDNKIVAIKVMIADGREREKAKRRFLSEIKGIKRIQSPYVVKALGWEWNLDSQYIVMEYINGRMLKEEITKRTRLSVDECINYTKQIALGLHEIHRQQVVHRDIKSSNIMIGHDGMVKIIDFGIALHDEAERVTQEDSIIGSVQYLAPELLDKIEATPQSDIYALGVLMYEMLIGEVPFRGKTAVDTAMMHKSKRIPQVNRINPNIPQSIANIIIKATAPLPSQRYRTAYEMYRDLDTALSSGRRFEPEIQLNQKPRRRILSFMNSKG